MTETAKTPLLSNRLFDALKFLAQILLPAVGTFYFALAGIWNLPNANEVVGSIVAFDTFLGVVLGLQTRAYNASDAKYDGSIDVLATPDKTTFSLVLNGDPEDLAKMADVNFKVNTK